MAIDIFKCKVCGQGRLETIASYAELPRVTSDCKPWPAGGAMSCCEACGAVQKLSDETWFDEIERIYKAYQIYQLSAGSEQVIFSEAGVAQPRSGALVDFIRRNTGSDSTGKLIDIGCGNGSALKNLSAAMPRWSLYGSELSDSAEKALRQLPNFVQLYTTPARDIPERFDILTMIHALEHMPDPLASLHDAACLLNDDGRLFVEIPNVLTSPFDLLIADHLLHFSPAHLSYLASRAGFSVSILRDDLLPKEITMLAMRGGAELERPAPARTRAVLEANLAWLIALLAEARKVAAAAGTFGIFGTSISGMWLYGALRDRVSFFVDEDASRVGNAFEGVPILSPAQAPAGSTVFVPLHPDVARRVAGRHAGTGAVYAEPPAYRPPT
ncbi:class I SAM-dependent methyltransferase [Bradyrhizobium sp. Tv2a-2]|uniref:class I SAM-dependent methyltransferase n=1 Tax=Bradyrhizobium sp. Tv2a-2 TaxID=113395 RepID=UPI0004222250|nr:class I SAM-dependent methyltransferase [Bradyrhizobium sp. Tv2a-2]